MRTYRGGTGWDGAVWPAATAGAADLTRWTYGATTGLLLAKTDANNAAVTYAYDLAGRRSTRTWARGVVTTYAYDPATGDLTGTTYSDGTPAVSNTYDRRGRLATVVDGSGSRSFTYTASGQVADETITYTGEPARTLTSTYDAWSRRTGIRVVGAYGSDSNITYSETTGLPIRPLGNYDSPAPVSYLPNSALPEFAGDSVRLTWSASRDVLESIGTPAYPDYGWSFTSTRDALSRITAESRDLGDGNGPSVRGFVYNSRSEVTASTGESYAYDAQGNRTTGNGQSYTPNALNQYSTVAGAAWIHDADGNLTSYGSAYGSATFVYDGENRLTQAGGFTFTYDYRHRVAKQTGTWQPLGSSGYYAGVAHRYYDGAKVVYRRDVCGGYTQEAGYAWGPDLAGRVVGGDGTGGLASVYSNGRTYYPIHDGRGNVWGFTESGQTVITRNLTSFGDGAHPSCWGVTATLPVSLLGFAHGTKEFIPALGLYLFGRRFYDPKTGRFLNRDPIAEDGGLNLYRFVSNNPVNSWDYNGLESMVDLLQQDPTIAPPSPTREYRPDSRWNVGINFNLGGGGRVDREEREERVDRCEELKREFERSRNDASFAAEDAIRQVLLALGEIAPIQTSSYEWGSLIYPAPEGYSRTSLLRGSPADPQNMGSYGLHDEQLREASMTYRRRSDGSLVIDTLDRKRIGGVAHGHTIDDLKGGQLSLADYVGGLSAYGLIGAVTAHTGHLYLFDARSMPENERERIQETLTKLIARQKADPNTLYTAENAFLSVPEDMWAQLARNTVTCPNFFE